MARSKLRIYFGPSDDQAENAGGSAAIATMHEQRPSVTVPLGEFFPVLAEAVSSGRAWIKDFEDDEITIPSDLYEVILAYQHYRRPSA